MTKAEQAKVYAIILDLAKLFGERCFVCWKPCLTGKGFTIHHLSYKEGEKDYRDFKTSKEMTDSERLKYWQYMEPIIRAEPSRFALLDNWHHVQVGRLRRFKDDKVIRRLFKLVLSTEYPKRRKR